MTSHLVNFFMKTFFPKEITIIVGDYMKKSFLIVFLVIMVIGLVMTGTLLIDSADDEPSDVKLYRFPISVESKTYMVTVRSNYSSVPEVKYFGLDKSVSVDFIGDPENAFCNITIPADLIWGDLSVIDKIYKMDDAYYTQSNNSTHNSIYFTFNHIALTKHFEIRATEGVSDSTQ